MPARQSAINFLHPVGAQHAAPGISTWRHRSDSGSGAFSDGSNRSRARRRRALGAGGSVFPTVIGIIPLKEVRDRDLPWYRFLLRMRLLLMWAAIISIFIGAIEFFRAV